MITKTYTAYVNLEHTPFQDCDPSGLLFFDIETTGLTARASSLYLIGAVSYQAPNWVATQWMAESPEMELEVLKAFLAFARPFSQVIHFNGDRFDLPYLQEKCRMYHLPDPFSHLISRDLFRMIRPLKSMLGLNALNQKSLEEYLGLFRRDPFTGGELIQIYHDYALAPNEAALNMLLLHNYEDLLGMLSILPLLSYLAIREGSYGITDAQRDGTSVNIRARLPLSLPRGFSLEEDSFFLAGEKDRLLLTVRGLQDTLKYFFADYKNYYYLPEEDFALHKSVAAFVDKEHRVPAKASTCYNKKAGFYLPQPEPLFTPVFRRDYASRDLFFACSDSFLQSREQLYSYVKLLLAGL